MDALQNANYDPMQNEPISHLSPEENLPSVELLSEGLKNLSCKNMFSYSTEPDRPQRKSSKDWKTESSQYVPNKHNTLKPEDDQFLDDMLKNNCNAPSAPENTDAPRSIKNAVQYASKEPLPTGTSRGKSIKQNWGTKDAFNDLNLKFSIQDDNIKFADDLIKYIEVKPIVSPQSCLKTRSEPNLVESPAQSAETRLCTASNQSVKDLGLWKSQSAVNYVPDSPNPPIIIDSTDEPSTKKIKYNAGYNQDTTMNKQEIQMQNPPIAPIQSPIQCAPVFCHPNPPIVPVRPAIQCAPALCHPNPVMLPDFTAPQSSSRRTTNVYQGLTTQNGNHPDSIDPLVNSDKKSLEDYKKEASNYVEEVTTFDNQRKWKCTFPNCNSPKKEEGFREAVRAKTHVMADHLGIQFACPEKSCSFTCNRLDNLSSHTRYTHKCHKYPNGYTLVVDGRCKDSPVKVDRYVKKAYLKRGK